MYRIHVNGWTEYSYQLWDKVYTIYASGLVHCDWNFQRGMGFIHTYIIMYGELRKLIEVQSMRKIMSKRDTYIIFTHTRDKPLSLSYTYLYVLMSFADVHVCMRICIFNLKIFV